MGGLLAWTGFAHTLLSGLGRFAQSTPDVTALPALAALWQTCLGLSAGLGALALAVAGGRLAVPWLVPTPMPLGLLFLRAAGAVLLATQSLHLVSWLIALTNAADAAIFQGPLLQRALSAPAPASGLVGLVLAVVPYIALLLVLAVIFAIRLVELFVLTAAAPLAVIVAIHPGGEAALRAWAAELVAVLLLQPVQVLLLTLFQVALIDLPGATSPVEALVSALAALYLTLRLPGWLRRFAHGTGHDQASRLLDAWSRTLVR